MSENIFLLIIGIVTWAFLFTFVIPFSAVLAGFNLVFPGFILVFAFVAVTVYFTKRLLDKLLS
jgi:hypothetical protein